MHKAALTLFVGFILPWSIQLAAMAQTVDSCVECHRQFETATNSPTKQMTNDIHFKRGLSCFACHGGDPSSMDAAVSMDPEKGFLGKPLRSDIPQFCARCHADPAYMRRYNPNLPTDQYAKYLTSQHGKKNTVGDPDVAVCTSCHETHGLRSKKDPFSPVYPTNLPATCGACHRNSAMMKEHGLSVTQYEEYAESVHGQALLVRGDRAAPHCASCHGSHEAAKPGSIAIGNVCAQCHSLSRDLFVKSPHKAAHEALGLPECEVCHGNHLILRPTDAMLGTGPQALCIKSHESGSTGHETAQRMRGLIEELKIQLAGAKEIVGEASRLGMYVSDAEFGLHEGGAKLTRARAYVHSFSADTMKPIIEEGIEHARAANEQGEAAIREFDFRRHGLWITLGIIVLLVGGLLLKIRDVEGFRDKK